MRELLKAVKETNAYSKTAVKMGALMMLCFYITGVLAYVTAPRCGNYFGVMALFRGCMEAAPASFAAGFCAAVICDLVLRGRR